MEEQRSADRLAKLATRRCFAAAVAIQIILLAAVTVYQGVAVDSVTLVLEVEALVVSGPAAMVEAAIDGAMWT